MISILTRIARKQLCVQSLGLACLIGFTPVMAAQAQEPDYFSLPPETLLSLEVTSASKRPEKLADAPAAISVITSEDIIRSGVTTIPEALRMVPGVHVAQADSNSWAISIRGFNSVLANKLLVLIDGRTVYNSLFAGTFWELQDLVLEDIDRIEVVRGPGGSLWGANAVNGVINVITKHSGETQGDLISMLAGNEKRAQMNYRHGGTFENGTYRVYAKGFETDSFTAAAGGDNHDAWHGYHSGFRADWGEKFTLQGDVSRTKTEQNRIDFSFTAPYEIPREQTLDHVNANILGRWSKAMEDGDLIVQSYLDYARRDEPFNFIDRRLTYDLEAQYNLLRKGRHEIVFGGGYRFIAANETSDDTKFTSNRRRDHLFNVFIQDQIELVPEEFYLTFGSKLEHNEFTGFEFQPNARLQWMPDERQTVWAAVSHAVRTPTSLETDVNSPLVAAAGLRFAIVGNDDFVSEELTAYEIGYRNQITPDFSIDLASFYNDYDQLATTAFGTPQVINNGIDPIYTLVPVLFENDMTGKGFGYEISAVWNAKRNLDLSLNYSFLRMILDAQDNSLINQETAEGLYPPHQVSLHASWDVNDQWSLDAAAYYVGELDEANVSDYVRFDMNIGYQVNENLKLNLIGQNLFDRSHREFGNVTDINAAEVDRSIFGKLTWQF